MDLEPQDWKATAKRTLKEVKDDRVTLISAGMAYYFFLAIFPALIALVGILGLVEADTQGLLDSVRSTLPGGAGEPLVEAIRESSSASESASLTAAIVGILLAVWSASSGMIALQSGLNVAYEIPEDRKFVGKRGIGLLLVVGTGLLGGVPSPLFFFGDSALLTVLGWILTIVAVTVLFSLYYFIGPNRSQGQWRWVSVGGAVGAVLWIAASLGFGFYVDNFGNYGKTYGSLAGVIVLIFWLFLTSLSVLVGGELNSELERQGERKARAA